MNLVTHVNFMELASLSSTANIYGVYSHMFPRIPAQTKI